MLVRDVEYILESWAPKEIAWERDNVGLQIGSHDKRVHKILVALDASEEVVVEAKKKDVDLIITHHPLLFRPPKSITPSDRVGNIVINLVQNNIALYSAHTNFDFTHGGVSFSLAEQLGLTNIAFLVNGQGHLRKVAVFVPAEHVDRVSEAMASTGAGAIGRYNHCSFRTEGTGTFRGGAGAKPFLGEAGKLEQVREVRLEMIVPRWLVFQVLEAMRRAHPYEEVAYDVFPLENESADYGMGAFGDLPGEATLKEFLEAVKEKLDIPSIRFVGEPQQRIQSVAVCGGSGSELLDAAIRRKADAFVTADVKYHAFESARGRIALIDAGHFETEEPSLNGLVKHLQHHIAQRKENVQVIQTSINTNPVQYY